MIAPFLLYKLPWGNKWDWVGTMATMAQGKAEFSQRLQRIEKRGVGVSEVFNADLPRARRPIRKAKAACKGCFMKLPLALAVGALSYLTAQYATFRIGDLPEEFSNPDYVLAGQALMALFLVFVARMFFSLTAKMHFLLSIVGLVAAMSLMHNLVHIAPEPFAELFSTDWVEDLRAHTTPGTLYFRGMSIPLSELSLG